MLRPELAAVLGAERFVQASRPRPISGTRTSTRQQAHQSLNEALMGRGPAQDPNLLDLGLFTFASSVCPYIGRVMDVQRGTLEAVGNPQVNRITR